MSAPRALLAGLLILSLSLLDGKANAVQPSVVPDGVEGPPPAVATATGVQGNLPQGPLSLAWAGGKVLVANSSGVLLTLDPATGALGQAASPNTSRSRPQRGRGKKSTPPLVMTASALGPAGQAAAIIADTVWVYDPATGAPKWKAPATGAQVLTWSVDGTALVGSGHNTLTVWNAATGVRVEAPDTRSDRFAYAARLQRLLVATEHGLDVYDATGASHLSDEGDLRALVLSADGRRAAVAGRKLWIWDLDARHLLAEVDAPSVSVLAFSADGSRLAVGEAGAEPVEVLDSATGARLGGVRAAGTAQALLFSPDNAEIWWLSQSALYHAATVQQDWTATLPASGRITALATTRDRAAVGTDTGLVSLWAADGTLLWSAQGSGTAHDLRLSEDGQLIAARLSADVYWTVPSSDAHACTPEVLPCTRLGTPNAPGLGTLPPALATAMLQGAWVAPFGDGGVEISGDQLRIWQTDGTLADVLWAGADGTWGRWASGHYFWGAMDPVFFGQGPDAAVRPPKADATLGADLPAVALIDSGPPADLQVLVKNSGPGPAYSVRAAWTGGPGVSAEGSAEIARLDAGASLPVRVHLAPHHPGDAAVSLAITSLYGAPVAVSLPVHVAPWPLSLGKVKRKKANVTVALNRAGDAPFGPVRVWLAVRGSTGGQSLCTGEAGKLAIWKVGQGSKDALVFDEMTLAAPTTELTWRLSDRNATDLRLVVQLPGGTPQEIPLPAHK